jgi:hypothetical protein
MPCGVLAPPQRFAMIPQFLLGVIGLDRMRQKNAGAEQCNKRGG